VSPTQVNYSARALRDVQLKMATPTKDTFSEVKLEILNLIVTDVLPGFYEEHNLFAVDANKSTANTSPLIRRADSAKNDGTTSDYTVDQRQSKYKFPTKDLPFMNKYAPQPDHVLRSKLVKRLGEVPEDIGRETFEVEVHKKKETF